MRIIKYLACTASTFLFAGFCMIGASAEETAEDETVPTVTSAVTTQTAAVSTAQTTTAETKTTIVSETQTSVTTASTAETTTAAETELDGWVKDEYKTYYYRNGQKLTGLNEIEGDTYFFAENGSLKTGWFTVDGIRVFFDIETGKKQTGWINYKNETYYADSEKGKLTGFNEIDGKVYLFDDNGILCEGWVEHDGNKYYCDAENGVYCGECVIDGITYIFSPKGKFQSGWQNVNGLRIFYDYDMAMPVHGWIHYNGCIYYSHHDTGKYTGDCTIDGIIYRFSKNGCIETGFQKFQDGTRYYDEDGKIGKGFIKQGEKVYYFGEDYLMKTGFVTVGIKVYYFDDNGVMCYGWQDINGKRYCFGDDGVMKTNWYKTNNGVYYLGENGVMTTGWKNIGSNRYYFDKNGLMCYDWQDINGKRYCFGNDGVMKKGWYKTNDGVYYLGENGVMTTGWKNIDGGKYYFNKDGLKISGMAVIDGKKYLFDSNGALICGKTVNGITTDSNGIVVKVMLNTPYLSQIGFPTGCESASAVMLLRSAGYSTTIDQFVDNALDKGWLYSDGNTLYGPDPNVAFIGDPRSEYGYGCYAPVIVNALNRVLKGGDKAVNITGTAMSKLLTGYIDKGIPVAVWATINMIEMEYGTQWVVPETGALFTWKSHEHCLVLVGYDNDYYYMNDPYKNNGLRAYSRSVVDNRYASMGSQAVVIIKP